MVEFNRLFHVAGQHGSRVGMNHDTMAWVAASPDFLSAVTNGTVNPPFSSPPSFFHYSSSWLIPVGVVRWQRLSRPFSLNCLVQRRTGEDNHGNDNPLLHWTGTIGTGNAGFPSGRYILSVIAPQAVSGRLATQALIFPVTSALAAQFPSAAQFL